VDHILVDGREFVGEQGIENLDESWIPFHDLLLRSGISRAIAGKNILSGSPVKGKAAESARHVGRGLLEGRGFFG
jgi:hypothetical protein